MTEVGEVKGVDKLVSMIDYDVHSREAGEKVKKSVLIECDWSSRGRCAFNEVLSEIDLTMQLGIVI